MADDFGDFFPKGPQKDGNSFGDLFPKYDPDKHSEKSYREIGDIDILKKQKDSSRNGGGLVTNQYGSIEDEVRQGNQNNKDKESIQEFLEGRDQNLAPIPNTLPGLFILAKERGVDHLLEVFYRIGSKLFDDKYTDGLKIDYVSKKPHQEPIDLIRLLVYKSSPYVGLYYEYFEKPLAEYLGTKINKLKDIFPNRKGDLDTSDDTPSGGWGYLQDESEIKELIVKIAGLKNSKKK